MVVYAPVHGGTCCVGACSGAWLCVLVRGPMSATCIVTTHVCAWCASGMLTACVVYAVSMDKHDRGAGGSASWRCIVPCGELHRCVAS